MSTSLIARNNKFDSTVENTVTGGEALGMYRREGRGAGWAR